MLLQHYYMKKKKKTLDFIEIQVYYSNVIAPLLIFNNLVQFFC